MSKPQPHAEGRLQLRGRFGFVLSEDPGLPDIYVTGPSLRQAMDGDRVQVQIIPGRKREGVILKVLTRARNSVPGILRQLKGQWTLVPEDTTIAPLPVAIPQNLKAEEGQTVVARITAWPTAKSSAQGILIEVLGWPRDKGVDVQTILRKKELPDAYPSEVLRETEHFPTTVSPEAWAGRTTYFHTPVFTIDGADAKDFDDAVSLEALPSGLQRLGVHIADVAQYVKLGTALEKEAYQRATSVYMVDRTVPMLPPALSEHLCSLMPDVHRLTLSCLMDMDEQGNIKSYKIVESVIKSVKRFTYESVEEIIKAHDPGPDPIRQAVTRMQRLARTLRRRRMERGSLDFDFPETKVILDANGRPTSIIAKERLESHKLIEEFMLAANEAVARHLTHFKIPTVYRIHERPDPTKLKKLSETLKVFGLPAPPKFLEGKHEGFRTVLQHLHGKPFQNVLERLLLRTLKQAVYSPKNVGHYGLASECYTHFTSPIRRYPDLCVHRSLKARLQNQLTPELKAWEHTMAQIGRHTSERERAAQEAEWESVDLKKVQFMQDKVGDIFDGVISSVTSFGFFVELLKFQVEGLVRVDSLEDDYYIFDEPKLCLIGRRTHKAFRPGQSVQIRLAAANEVKRELDFQLVKKG